MGKVFKSPKIKVSAPVSEEAAKTEAAAEKAETTERQRRGMDSMVRTSYNGILDVKNMDLNRKKLLGE